MDIFLKNEDNEDMLDVLFIVKYCAHTHTQVN